MAWLQEEAGFDAAIDYKNENVKELARTCTERREYCHDNVGGKILDDMLANVPPMRIVVCGGISRYGRATPAGPQNYFNLIFRRATMAGFIVLDYTRSFRLSGNAWYN